MEHEKGFAKGLSIGIIMDGNGRWAKRHGLPRTAGHKKGAEVFKDIIRYCNELEIASVTFYAFSTENWKRPQEEVIGLMNLFATTMLAEVDGLHEEHVRVMTIGRTDELPKKTRDAFAKAWEKTKDNDGMTLVVAVMIPVFILVSFSRRKAMRTASRRVKKKTAVINADIESALSGIRTAKAFANEPVEAEKFTRSNDTYKTSKKQFHKEMGIFMGTMEFFTTSLSVAVVAVGGLLIMQGQMDTVDLLTFTLYIASFVTPIRKLANFSELYANGTAGFERFLEIPADKIFDFVNRTFDYIPLREKF